VTLIAVLPLTFTHLSVRCLLQVVQFVASGWSAEQKLQVAQQLQQQATEELATSGASHVHVSTDKPADDSGLFERPLHQWSKKRPLQPSTLSNTSDVAGAMDAPTRGPPSSLRGLPSTTCRENPVPHPRAHALPNGAVVAPGIVAAGASTSASSTPFVPGAASPPDMAGEQPNSPVDAARMQSLLHSLHAIAVHGASAASNGDIPAGDVMSNAAVTSHEFGSTTPGADIAHLEAFLANVPTRDASTSSNAAWADALHTTPVGGSPPRSVATKRLACERTPVKGAAEKLSKA
jgi:hypothetical protein